MKRNSIIFFFGLLIIFLVSGALPNLFFPGDILLYLPGFSALHWQPPHNSLLADPVFQFEPWRVFAKERFLHGEIPLWNNQNGAGIPFLANPQAAIFFPLTFFYYLFPVKFALWLIPLTKLYLFGVFTYLYIVSLRCSKKIAFLGSITASFSAFPVMWILWPQTNIFILLPLLLYLIEKIFQSTQNTYRWYFLLSIIVFFGISGGHPETLFHAILICVFYLIIRLWDDKKKILKSFFSLMSGFLFGSFQLIPFLEYLLHSEALVRRNTQSINVLPLKSIIFDLFPFLLGAPQTRFYKPITPYTNFQETVSGYVGTFVILVGLFGFWFLRRKRIAQIWITIILFAFGISYGIFPFSLFNLLPVFKNAANYRLIGFAGFGLIILFALMLQTIETTQFVLKKKYKTHILAGAGIICIFLLIGTGVGSKAITAYQQNFQTFFPTLRNHIIFITISTLLAMLVVAWALMKKNPARKYILPLLIIPIFLQNIGLFWNYNAVLPKETYYPQNAFIKKLQTLPKGNILEVGNLLFPPSLNLVYGLSSAQSDDAIGYAPYEKAFANAFPQKNQWGRVENPRIENLQLFNISYVISDYDINLKKISLQNNHSVLSMPVTRNTKITIPFQGTNNPIVAIRFLPATFNRENICQVYLTIKITAGKETSNTVNCSAVRDGMYYTVKLVSPIPPHVTGELSFSSNAVSKENAIALWGNKKNIPFVDFLQEQQARPYQLLWNNASTFLWKVPGETFVTGARSYRVILDKREETQIVIDVDRKTDVVIKKTNYPGWSAMIDGRPAVIKKDQLFMKISVPKGEHIINLIYRPFSFFIGTLISILTCLTMLTFFIRFEKDQRWIVSKHHSWQVKARRIAKREKFTHYVFITFSFWCIGIILCCLCITMVIPKQIPLPVTTAVNWLIVHKHSIMLDYLRFCVIVCIIPIVIIGGWTVFIWRKRQ